MVSLQSMNYYSETYIQIQVGVTLLILAYLSIQIITFKLFKSNCPSQLHVCLLGIRFFLNYLKQVYLFQYQSHTNIVNESSRCHWLWYLAGQPIEAQISANNNKKIVKTQNNNILEVWYLSTSIHWYLSTDIHVSTGFCNWHSTTYTIQACNANLLGPNRKSKTNILEIPLPIKTHNKKI